ncbi:hypothetical protein C0Q70_05855 [Pomacea canaliculata]|uniref:Uncharacterized protein n=1 Tax=Pomacea canaliculata TaxID=400727 RepID=A0A2T7PMD2_POMCA|nr:hypothetical protein C0Q70_05855 [Pomacea canaliculata]
MQTSSYSDPTGRKRFPFQQAHAHTAVVCWSHRPHHARARPVKKSFPSLVDCLRHVASKPLGPGAQYVANSQTQFKAFHSTNAPSRLLAPDSSLCAVTSSEWRKVLVLIDYRYRTTTSSSTTTTSTTTATTTTTLASLTSLGPGLCFSKSTSTINPS